MSDEYDSKSIVDELAISSDLTAEFRDQSAHYAHWAFLAARAADRVRLLEERVELSFAELYAAYRDEHEDAKENDCKSYIRRQPEHKAMTQKLRRAQHDADVLKAAVRAFEMRRDMLIQLGAQFRAEEAASGMGAPRPHKQSREEMIKRAGQIVRKTYAGKRGEE